MKNKDLWKTVIQFAISILTAALTAMSTTSCMGHGPIFFKKWSHLHVTFKSKQ